MPAPRSIARVNRRFTNRLFLKMADYLPGFAIVSHVGGEGPIVSTARPSTPSAPMAGTPSR